MAVALTLAFVTARCVYVPAEYMHGFLIILLTPVLSLKSANVALFVLTVIIANTVCALDVAIIAGETIDPAAEDTTGSPFRVETPYVFVPDTVPDPPAAEPLFIQPVTDVPEVDTVDESAASYHTHGVRPEGRETAIVYL
jgi:hypothetical protein